MDFQEELIVEAIKEGKIVRVSEDYAKREGLFILRKPKISQLHERSKIPSKLKSDDDEDKRKISHDLTSRPLNWRKNQVVQELIENFQWEITKKRKILGLTKKQLANLIGEKEEVIKSIEYGIFPSNDFVIINKIQNILNINLRKDQVDINKSMHEMLEAAELQQRKKEFPYKEHIEQRFRQKSSEKKSKQVENPYGNEIQLFNDEEI